MNESVQRRQTPGNLAWLDLEMTGLDAERDVILQAALVITDRDLKVLEQFCCDIWQPAQALEKMTPFVRAMHKKSGLIERVQKSELDQGATERALLERVAGWCTYPAVLCGNSISQDKLFLSHHMPSLAGYLSYRILDVSSIKIIARLWYGESALYRKPEEGAHDALFDIRQSLAELAHYRDHIFRDRG